MENSKRTLARLIGNNTTYNRQIAQPKQGDTLILWPEYEKEEDLARIIRSNVVDIQRLMSMGARVNHDLVRSYVPDGHNSPKIPQDCVIWIVSEHKAVSKHTPQEPKPTTVELTTSTVDSLRKSIPTKRFFVVNPHLDYKERGHTFNRAPVIRMGADKEVRDMDGKVLTDSDVMAVSSLYYVPQVLQKITTCHEIKNTSTGITTNFTGRSSLRPIAAE